MFEFIITTRITKKTIGKMGLKGVPGLRIGAFIPRQGGHHNRGGR